MDSYRESQVSLIIYRSVVQNLERGPLSFIFKNHRLDAGCFYPVGQYLIASSENRHQQPKALPFEFRAGPETDALLADAVVVSNNNVLLSTATNATDVVSRSSEVGIAKDGWEVFDSCYLRNLGIVRG